MVDDYPEPAPTDDHEPDQRRAGEPFMIRCNIPGGRLTAEHYLLLDDVATRQMHGSLRITARYNIQLHGALERDLQDTIAALSAQLRLLLTPGDAVGRPIMGCPAPAAEPAHVAVHAIARQVSAHLLGPAMGAYEFWFGGEKVAESPLTGPRGRDAAGEATPSIHFKIGIAAPGDNCIDVYTHDLGLVPVVDEGILQGFNVLVGGSMGMARQIPGTVPRLGEALAFVTPLQVIPMVDQLLDIERQAAAQARRQRGRFKHLVSAWGVGGLRSELEGRLGFHLGDSAPTLPADLDLHLGWHPQGDDRWYLGLSIENGRIQNQGDRRLQTGLRDIVMRFQPDVCLTPNQDLLLTGLSAAHRVEVESRLRAYGIPWPDEFSALRRYAMACPAMPTCGHALAEAERALPALIDQLEVLVDQLGLADECLSIRMNGCSFGCTRPYVADLAFIGDAPGRYSVFLGGRADGSRVNWLFRELVLGDALVPTVRPLLVFFSRARKPGETFGDFCTRVGRDALQSVGASCRDGDGPRC
jgi:sulfite reductase (ferredoxin)